MGLLGRLHRQRLRGSVAGLPERLYAETRVLASLVRTRRGAASVANLEKVVSLARQADALGVLTLRGFIRFLAHRMQEGSEEPDLPSTRPGDPDTVRILSIHKAKGLEAPIVVLHDTAANLQVDSNVIALWGEGKVAVGFRAGCRPPDWKTLAERDKAKARAEGRRLLYVACTRARDWLVIPQPPESAQAGDFWSELMPHLAASPPEDVRVLDVESLPLAEPVRDTLDQGAIAVAEGGDAVAARWEKQRRDLIETAARRPFVPASATAVAARGAPPSVTRAEASGGRSFGSLVHRLLEWTPLEESSPDAIGAMAEALAPSHGLDPDGARRAAEAVRTVLALPLLERARRARRVFRELPLVFPEGADLVEGVVDLVFEEEGGFVLVDYKTDAIAPGQELAQAAHHAPQLRLYGRGLAQATGLPVKERLVVFTQLGCEVRV
jgi:ATP-dependent helicase/nuclease subunit A